MWYTFATTSCQMTMVKNENFQVKKGRNFKFWATEVLYTSDLGGGIDIADPVTGTFVFIKLGYLKNFMSNKGSMKCL